MNSINNTELGVVTGASSSSRSVWGLTTFRYVIGQASFIVNQLTIKVFLLSLVVASSSAILVAPYLADIIKSLFFVALLSILVIASYLATIYCRLLLFRIFNSIKSGTDVGAKIQVSDILRLFRYDFFGALIMFLFFVLSLGPAILPFLGVEEGVLRVASTLYQFGFTLASLALVFFFFIPWLFTQYEMIINRVGLKEALRRSVKVCGGLRLKVRLWLVIFFSSLPFTLVALLGALLADISGELEIVIMSGALVVVAFCLMFLIFFILILVLNALFFSIFSWTLFNAWFNLTKKLTIG